MVSPTKGRDEGQFFRPTNVNARRTAKRIGGGTAIGIPTERDDGQADAAKFKAPVEASRSDEQEPLPQRGIDDSSEAVIHGLRRHVEPRPLPKRSTPAPGTGTVTPRQSSSAVSAGTRSYAVMPSRRPVSASLSTAGSREPSVGPQLRMMTPSLSFGSPIIGSPRSESGQDAEGKRTKMSADVDQDEADEEEGGKTSRRKERAKRPKKRTVSDDEADYLVQVAQHGASMVDARLNERTTSMSDLSDARFGKGRASAKTFDMERKLRQEKRERAHIRRQMRNNPPGFDATLNGLHGLSAPRADRSEGPDRRSAPHAAEVSDGEAATTDDQEDGQSDAESIGAASTSTHHTLRDKKFSVRTRIVDGKIVLDESSLQQSRNDDAGLNGQGEPIDINESDRFVNSATYAKPRMRNDRWTAEETERFLEAVSMWGSDFGMIAYMFPLRNRQQIRTKWRSMERTNGRSLDMAFKRRLPVDLEAYGQLAGVDLSGEPPQIEARQPVVKKAEEEQNLHLNEDLENADSMPFAIQKQEVERDENGLEIVDEGDDAHVPTPSMARRERKTSSASMAAPSAAFAGAQHCPTIEQDNTQRTARAGRARSSSTASHAGTVQSASSSLLAGSAHAAPWSAATDRGRRARQHHEETRKEREFARRRPAPSGEEEIIG